MISIFLILTFLLSWLLIFLLPFSYSDLAMFIPAIVSIILTIYNHEKLRYLFRFTSVINLLAGLGLSIGAFSIYLIIISALGSASFGLPEATIQYYNGNIFRACSHFLLYIIPYMLSINLLFAAGEEIGWRGYLLKKSQPLISNFWCRSLFVGIFWGIWHLPIYMIEGTPAINILIFIINVFLISVCYNWLYERVNSVWPVIFAHGTHNTLFNSILPMITIMDKGNSLLNGETGIVVTGSYLLLILIVLCISKINHLCCK